MVIKRKIIAIATLSVLGVFGGVVGIMWSPSLPSCDNEAKVNLNLSRLFVDQVQQGGATMKGLSIVNLPEKNQALSDINQCVSTVTMHTEKEGIVNKLVYDINFDIKWHDKEKREYIIELTKMIARKTDNTAVQKDIEEISSLIIPVNHVEDIQQHDILFFASLKEGDGFITLFKDKDNIMFIIGGKDDINHQIVSPELVPTAAAGGSTQFESDGVRYRIDVDGAGGASLEIKDGSGTYTLSLDTGNKLYINRLPPAQKS